jgi:hypothetical protein
LAYSVLQFHLEPQLLTLLVQSFFIVLLFICAYKTWVISLPCPTPSLTTHSNPKIPGRKEK